MNFNKYFQNDIRLSITHGQGICQKIKIIREEYYEIQFLIIKMLNFIQNNYMYLYKVNSYYHNVKKNKNK